MVDELRHMIAEWEEITEQWYEALPIEIQAVYTNNGDKRVTQVPVLVELLKLAGHQGHSELEKDSHKDLTWLSLTPGTGWLPRLDGRYAAPISMEEFYRQNCLYVQEKLKTARPSPHWRVMLDELLAEQQKGQVEGPLQAPEAWGMTLPECDGISLQRAPTERAWAAMCFEVVQSGKVRRCEDYRRSYHNSTVRVGDCPHYNGGVLDSRDASPPVLGPRTTRNLGAGLDRSIQATACEAR